MDDEPPTSSSFQQFFQQYFGDLLRGNPELAQGQREKLAAMTPEEMQAQFAGLRAMMSEQRTGEPWALLIAPDGDGYRVLELPPVLLDHTSCRIDERELPLLDLAMKWGRKQKNAYYTEKFIHAQLKHRRKLETDPEYRREHQEMAEAVLGGMTEAFEQGLRPDRPETGGQD